MKKIVLVGVGGIGRYHLVGLSGMAGVQLQVVDRSETAIEETRQLIARIGGKTPIEYVNDIGASWENADLTIIATQAGGRVPLVKALLQRGGKAFVLEKLVAQSDTEYDQLLAAFAASGARAWINTPMRYHPLYTELSELLRGQVISLGASGTDVGLATNSIHFVDLFAYLTGGWRGRFAGAAIADTPLANKRGSTLVEFGGTLVGRDDTGNTITVTNLAVTQATFTITITSEPLTCFIDVAGGTWHLAQRSNEWRARTEKYREPRVSEITPLIADDILNRGSTRLPAIADLREAHRDLFRVFREHLARVNGNAPDVLPIT